MIISAHDQALQYAIRLVGSQSKLAKHLKIRRQVINYWLNYGKRIPFDYACAIEKLRNGLVTRYELAPYENYIKKIKPLKCTNK